MHAFMAVDLENLFDMSDIHHRAGRDITGGSDGSEPLGRADDRQGVEGCESGVC